MKKMGALLGILAILCLGGFFWLLSQAKIIIRVSSARLGVKVLNVLCFAQP